MKVSLAPQTIIHPHPVLIISTYGEDGRPNMMTASWAGICCSEPPCIAVSLRKATETYHNIVRQKAFTVGVPSERHVSEADYVGTVSARDFDKFAETGFTAVRSELVDAPYVKELPFSLECKLLHMIEIGLHTQFIGEIVGIVAEDYVLGPSGKPDIEKVRPIMYGSHGSPSYYGIGKNLGTAFTLRDKRK